MDITSLLDEKTILPSLEAENKKEVLNKLISTLSTKVEEEEMDTIRNAVFEREKIMSTGVGKGLAIPHGKAAGINDNYAAFAILRNPVNYEAVDEEPVSLVFLLVGPQSSNSLHIKMLSRISRLMNNSEFRSRLIQCTSASEIMDIFEKEEKAYFSS